MSTNHRNNGLCEKIWCSSVDVVASIGQPGVIPATLVLLLLLLPPPWSPMLSFFSSPSSSGSPPHSTTHSQNDAWPALNGLVPPSQTCVPPVPVYKKIGTITNDHIINIWWIWIKNTLVFKITFSSVTPPCPYSLSQTRVLPVPVDEKKGTNINDHIINMWWIWINIHLFSHLPRCRQRPHMST